MTSEAWIAIVALVVGLVALGVGWLVRRVDGKASTDNVVALRKELNKARETCAASDAEIKIWVREYSASRVDTTRLEGRLDALQAGQEDIRETTHAILRKIDRPRSET